MKQDTAFWDASALVPLCVHEAASRSAHSHLRKFAPVVWWGSLLEIQSAISRLHREKQITDAGKKGASERLQFLGGGWREILPGDSLRELSMELLDEYSLRAADSLQLAASLTWCEQRPARRRFICGDKKLSQAANSIGFSVLELPRAAARI